MEMYMHVYTYINATRTRTRYPSKSVERVAEKLRFSYTFPYVYRLFCCGKAHILIYISICI